MLTYPQIDLGPDIRVVNPNPLSLHAELPHFVAHLTSVSIQISKS